MSSKGAIARLTDATNNYNALLKDQYTQAQTNYQPYTNTGTNALAKLNDPASNFTTSPGYQFRLDQGLNGVTQNKAVGGMLHSGSALKSLSDYGQNTASNEYNNWFGQQMGLANLGMQGTNALTQVGSNYANGVGQNGLNLANGITGIKNAQQQSNNSLLGGLVGAGLNIASGGTYGAITGGLKSLGGLWGSVGGSGAASAASPGVAGYNFGFA